MTIDKMKERKIELGLSNEMLAELSGVPLGTIHKVFSGQTKNPRYETIRALAAVLNPSYGDAAQIKPIHSKMNNMDSASYGKIKPEPSMIQERSAVYQTADPAHVSENNLSEGAAVYQSTEPKHFSYKPHSGGPGNYDETDPRQGTYTIDDYYTLPDNPRVELIDGYIYEMTAPSKIHQTILLQLALQIAPCTETHPECELFIAPSDVCLDNDRWTMVQPDLFINCGNADNDPRRTNGAPDFIIEILSPSNRFHDMFRKLNKYRLANVREYWIIDPQKLKITVYDFEHEEPPVTYTFEDTIQIGISDGGCKVDFAKIYEKIKRYLQ